MTSIRYNFEPLKVENFNRSLEFFKNRSKYEQNPHFKLQRYIPNTSSNLLKSKRSKSLVSIPDTSELIAKQLVKHRPKQQQQQYSRHYTNRLSQLLVLNETLLEEQNENELSEDDIDFIELNTGFKRDQIKGWYNEFMSKSPNGLISEKQFCSFYESLMPTNLNSKSKTNLAAKLFKVFDIDADGYLNFPEFLVSFWVRCQAPLEEKFTWIFNMLDSNHNGLLDYNELRNAISSCLNLNDLDELLEQLNDEKLTYMQQVEHILEDESEQNDNNTNHNNEEVDENDDDDDDEAFFEDPSSSTSVSSSKSNLQFETNESLVLIKHQQQYSVYSRTTKLLDDKVHELILMLNASINFFHNKSQTQTQVFFQQQQQLKKINLTRNNFVDLCVRYKSLRKLLMPIKNYYDCDLTYNK